MNRSHFHDFTAFFADLVAFIRATTSGLLIGLLFFIRSLLLTRISGVIKCEASARSARSLDIGLALWLAIGWGAVVLAIQAAKS